MQWQVGTWPRFFRPRGVERDKKVVVKEYIKLDKIMKRGYVRIVEVKNLTK